jgi:uncharacterized membrane protein
MEGFGALIYINEARRHSRTFLVCINRKLIAVCFGFNPGAGQFATVTGLIALHKRLFCIAAKIALNK